MENKPKEKSKKTTMLRIKISNIVVCLSIASVFWVFNALSHDYSAVVKYPVRLIINPDKYISNGSLTKDISVAVSGYGWSILTHSFGFRNQPLLISTKDLDADQVDTEASLLPQLRNSLSDVKVLNIIEDSLRFEVDYKESKKVYLKLDKAKLSLPNGTYIKNKPQIFPGFIICNGARKSIKSLPDTINFSLPNVFIETNFNDNVEINYRPSRDITLAYNTVKVSFSLAKK